MLPKWVYSLCSLPFASLCHFGVFLFTEPNCNRFWYCLVCQRQPYSLAKMRHHRRLHNVTAYLLEQPFWNEHLYDALKCYIERQLIRFRNPAVEFKYDGYKNAKNQRHLCCIIYKIAAPTWTGCSFWSLNMQCIWHSCWYARTVLMN